MTTNFSMSGLTKTFGKNVVVDELDLEIEDGDFVVLLGPSGCGKTTTLRCLAGLETPETGTIRFKSKTVFDSASRINVPTHKRNIGMVFQSYALWPHMTVRRNIAYPLRMRGDKRAISSGRVEEAAEMVHCGELLDRYPSQLSGGQQQRIALARGLVAQPELVLLDEPLSNLDARLRDQVRTEIKELHQRLGFTAVLVTHDQGEAFALANRVAIMRNGKIEQLDPPDHIFRTPASEYVANFIGMSNRLAWTRDADGWTSVGGARATLADLGVGDHERVVSRFDIEALDVHHDRAEVETVDDRVVLDAHFVAGEYGGRTFEVTVEADGTRLHSRVETRVLGAWIRSLAPGDPVVVSAPLERLRTFLPELDGEIAGATA